ncbi:unnamed protein product [Trichobilharzia regenti]|nr:unnamed protein product [Trichobilharzia regenti]
MERLLFHFPHTSSHPSSSDRLSRSLSNEPAVKLNGTLYIPQGEPNPRSRIVSMNTQICQDFISELHIDVSHFCVDLDISIMDRIHRIADALAAASEAVARLSPLKPTDFSNHAEWYDTDLRNDGPVLTKSDHYHADYDVSITSYLSQRLFIMFFNYSISAVYLLGESFENGDTTSGSCR